ncbi:hypothetical protein EI94DRAFT_1708289 [Lactarius quietus]|nr:hypothetical protein EI94DRAFT_1708289 [Lactarius quietus]
MQGTALRLLILIGIGRNLLYITAPVLEGGMNCIQAPITIGKKKTCCTHLTFLVSLTVPTPTVFENETRWERKWSDVQVFREASDVQLLTKCGERGIKTTLSKWRPTYQTGTDATLIKDAPALHSGTSSIAATANFSFAHHSIVFMLVLFGIFCQDFEQLLEGRDTL